MTKNILFTKYLYKLYFLSLSLPWVLLLIMVGWKRHKLRVNTALCGLPYSFGFRVRFYTAVVFDLLRFIHGKYEDGIHPRPRDSEKLRLLKFGSSLYLTAHFHNWELMGAWMTRQGIPLLSGARSMHNPLSQKCLTWFRSRLGMKVAFHALPRSALRHLNESGCFALLWDQRASGSADTALFFGYPLPMDPLPVFLVRHTSVPVFFGILLPGGSLRLIQLANPDRSRDPYRQLSRRYHRVLEFLVRVYPTYWYGLAHGRFQDLVDYGSRVHVSRETSTPSGVMVSRETKVSLGLPPESGDARR